MTQIIKISHETFGGKKPTRSKGTSDYRFILDIIFGKKNILELLQPRRQLPFRKKNQHREEGILRQ